MICIFEDGRIIYDGGLLTPEDNAIGTDGGKKYVEVSELPVIPGIEGKTGYLFADLKEKKVKIGYYDTPQPIAEPEFMPETEDEPGDGAEAE